MLTVEHQGRELRMPQGKAHAFSESRYMHEPNQIELQVEQVEDAILIVNENGIITHLNDLLLDIFEYTREEIIDHPIEMLAPPEIREKHVEWRMDFQKAAKFRTLDQGKLLNLRGVTKSGKVIPVLISLVPVIGLTYSVVVIVQPKPDPDEILQKNIEKLEKLKQVIECEIIPLDPTPET